MNTPFTSQPLNRSIYSIHPTIPIFLIKSTPRVKSPSIVHNRGHGCSKSFTLCRGCTTWSTRDNQLIMSAMTRFLGRATKRLSQGLYNTTLLTPTRPMSLTPSHGRHLPSTRSSPLWRITCPDMDVNYHRPTQAPTDMDANYHRLHYPDNSYHLQPVG